MRYVSLFSGIEAASVAWIPLGWHPIAYSEIEPYPSAVLTYRYPQTPNLGDITQIRWEDHDECLSADIVVGGSPCQSFSIAGDRSGLRGASGLMWEYVRAVQAIRPRWLLWENVPGTLSSSGGRDFVCLLSALDELGYGLAWRVLDAQYYGVAQRRRRVYLVGSLGSQRATEVLFEPESLQWDYPTSRQKRETLTCQSRDSSKKTSKGDNCITPWDTQSRRVYRPNGPWPTLDAREHSGIDGKAIALDFNPSDSRIRYADTDISQTLTARMGTGGNQVPLVQNMKTLAFLPNAGSNAGTVGASDDISPTLKTDHNPAVLCVSDQQQNATIINNLAQTLTAHGGSYISRIDLIRRLTPTECERLQGFPDGYTDVPFRGKPHAPDSHRYKALGNSMATPVMRWIGKRLEQVDKDKTMEDQ
ncbi:MAG: hypothetical protein [Caudoviricetes sp.]|nr:MAG: hypothetical protein [Caudoviricetes sp.]